jgi:hypothetical protein
MPRLSSVTRGLIYAERASTEQKTFNRLIVSFDRVIRKRLIHGVEFFDTIHEEFNLVHPNDEGSDDKKKSSRMTFGQLGEIFKGNPLFKNVKYTTTTAVLPVLSKGDIKPHYTGKPVILVEKAKRHALVA